MKRAVLTVILLLVGIAAVAAYLTLFTVYQTQQALVLEFGKPKRLVTTPGLNYKIPFIQSVSFFDKRLLDLDSAPQEVIASDQKRLVVDALASSLKRLCGACLARRASRPWCAMSGTS